MRPTARPLRSGCVYVLGSGVTDAVKARRVPVLDTSVPCSPRPAGRRDLIGLVTHDDALDNFLAKATSRMSRTDRSTTGAWRDVNKSSLGTAEWVPWRP